MVKGYKHVLTIDDVGNVHTTTWTQNKAILRVYKSIIMRKCDAHESTFKWNRKLKNGFNKPFFTLCV